MSRNQIKEPPGPKVVQDNIVYSINIKEQTAVVIGFDQPIFEEEDEVDLFIPRSINYESKEYIITSIYNRAFKDQLVKSVTFPSDSEVRTIEEAAFCFSTIEKFTIPPHLTIISNDVFNGCSNLHNLEFPPNCELRTIEYRAFNFVDFEKFTIPASLIELKNGWCSFLDIKSIDIDPSNPRYKKYGENFIIGKSNVSSEIFDELVYCFRHIEKVTIPDSIKIIKGYAFQDCNQLVEVEISPNSNLQIIEDNAFELVPIQKFTILPHLTEIGPSAFADSKIQTIEIPPNSKLHTIGNNAFENTLIERFTIPPHLTTLSACMFYGCKNLKTIDVPSDSELQIIKKEAFYDSPLESLTIPSNFVKFCEEWGDGANQLNNIKIDNKNPLFLVYENKLIIGKSSIESKTYDEIVFCYKDNTEVTIPSSIKTILPYSFYRCKKLQKINFQNNSMLQTIGKFAFYESSITSITIPSSTTRICCSAFSDCRKLESCVIPSNSELRIIEESAFAYTHLINFTIPLHLTEISKSTFDHSGIQTIEIPENSELKTIEDCAFSQSPIQKFVVPHHLTKIGRSAFSYCRKLESFVIPSNSELRTIGTQSFCNSKIETFSIPASLVELEDGWNLNMNKLMKIDLSPQNPIYSKLNEKIIVKKSSPNSEIFDEIFFVVKEK